MVPVHAAQSQQELRPMVLEILGKSSKPLTALAVVKQLPKLYRVPEAQVAEVLDSLRQAGSIFSWGVSRQRELFALESPQQRARQAILNALQGTLTPVQLKKKAAPGAKGKLYTDCLKELVQEGLVLKLPKAGERYTRPLSLEEALETFRKQFPGIEISVSAPLAERIQQAILAAEPRAKEGALASIPQVRLHLHPAVPKEQFDAALLELGRQGLLSIHIFYGHAQVSEQERDELVFDQKENYYGGVTFRHH